MAGPFAFIGTGATTVEAVRLVRVLHASGSAGRLLGHARAHSRRIRSSCLSLIATTRWASSSAHRVAATESRASSFDLASRSASSGSVPGLDVIRVKVMARAETHESRRDGNPRF